MSVIAVDNISPKNSLKNLVNELRKPIRGEFEALNFGQKPNPNGTKICYLQLSAKLDPVQVVESINADSKLKYTAFIPDVVPDIPLVSMKARLKRATPAVRKQLLIAARNANGKIYHTVTEQIMSELQAKYPRLYNLNKKYENKLFTELNQKIHSRVQEILEASDAELQNSSFKATYAYRNVHLHSEDFNLVQSTVHDIEEAAGSEKSEILEADIALPLPAPLIQNLPQAKIQPLCSKYSAKILEKMVEHLNASDCDIKDSDKSEDKARKRVRLELKKLQPFMSKIINQVVTRQITSGNQDYKMRVYAEPALPSRDVIEKFLYRFNPKTVTRSLRMHNLMLCTVPPGQCAALLAKTGTDLNGSKLVIGLSDVITFKAGSTSANEGEGEEIPAEDEVMDDSDVVDTTAEPEAPMDVEDY